MRNRIEVSISDVEKLLAWRDEHKDLVRSMPCPLREVEIRIIDNGLTVKCFRNEKKLKLYVERNSNRLGHVVFTPIGDGLWNKKISTLPPDCSPRETEQGALTLYGSLMALMTYGPRRLPVETEKHEHQRKSISGDSSKICRSKDNVCYIIHSESGGGISVAPKGSHASPSCTFSVRGHYRHYKSGKTIWISEYEKGTGRNREKTYRIGEKI